MPVDRSPEIEVDDAPSPFTRFLRELLRRRVLRVAAVYAASGWVILEVADTVAPLLLLPEWTSTLVLLLVLLGFPFVTVLAWAFDVTPEGVRRAEPAAAHDGRESNGPASGRRWRVSRIAVVGAVAILAITGAALLTGRGTAPHAVAHRVAVVPFENRTGQDDLNDLGVIAADWITDGLSDIDTVEVVPTARVLDVVERAGARTDAAAALLRDNQAGLVITGSFRLVGGDSVEMRARLIDAVAGRVLSSTDPAPTPRSDPTAALTAVGQQIIGHVAAKLDRFGEVRADAVRPSYEAYQAFIAGRELFAADRYPEAIREFDRGRAADSTFFQPLVWTAIAFHNLGQLAKQDSVLRMVEPHRSELSEANRVTLDWAEAVLGGDVPAAYRAALQQFRLAPTDMTRYVAGLYAEWTHRYGEAVELMDVAPLESVLRNTWLWYASVLDHALHMLGSHERELELATVARHVFPDHPRALVLEGVALAALGRTTEAEVRARDILALPREGGTVARVVEIGDVLALYGHEDAPNTVFTQALGWARDHGRADPVERHHNVAAVLRRLGQLEAAAEHVLAAREAAPEDSDVLALQGVIAAQQGDRSLAEQVAAEVRSRAGPYDLGHAAYHQARIRAQLGDRDRAVDLLRQAHARGAYLSYRAFTNPDLRPLQGYGPFDNLLRPRG